MPAQPFRVTQIDHVEVYVPDRYEGAKWYQEILGLEILKEHEHWADSNGGGPLMISSDSGNTMIALFQGKPDTSSQRHTVAFRVDGTGFMQFIDHMEGKTVHDDTGNTIQITRDSAKDHEKAFSIYFNDPWGNRYEVTSYGYEEIKTALGL